MAKQIESGRSKAPLRQRAVAALILVAVAALVVHLALGLIIAVFWIALVVAVIGGALWAFKTLF